MHKYYFFLLLSLGLLACNSGQSTSDGQGEQSEAAAAQSGRKEVGQPVAAESNADAEFPVPVYMTFEEIEPLFRKENDTTYVINFWATWCKPCVKELPYFEQLNRKYRGDKVKVILVSLDFANALETKLLPFLENNELESEVVVLLDGRYNQWIDKIDPEWGGAIPATLVYDADQRKFVEASFADYHELETMLESIL